MPIVGFRFRAYTDEQTLRALKAQLRLRERRAMPFVGQGGVGKREAP
jgi:transposase